MVTQAGHTQDGDEVPVWWVYVADEEAELIHTMNRSRICLTTRAGTRTGR